MCALWSPFQANPKPVPGMQAVVEVLVTTFVHCYSSLLFSYYITVCPSVITVHTLHRFGVEMCSEYIASKFDLLKWQFIAADHCMDKPG